MRSRAAGLLVLPAFPAPDVELARRERVTHRNAERHRSRPPHRDAAAHVRVIRRDGTVSRFDASKISVAMTKAFLAVEGTDAAASSRLHEIVEELTAQVVAALLRHAGPDDRTSTSRTSRTRSNSR